MDTLPIELLHIIASDSSDVYRALLGYKFFVQSLTPSKITDYMILFGYSVEITTLQIEWYRNGKLHRINGPAREYANKCNEWYRNGKLHRLDGPAVEFPSGSKYWYQNNKLHREDGPAAEWNDGTKIWYLNDQRHRIGGPAVEWPNGVKQYYQYDRLYNEDGTKF